MKSVESPLYLESGSEPRLVMRGDWTLARFAWLKKRVSIVSEHVSLLDASAVEALDTAGATVLVNALGAERLSELLKTVIGLSPERKALLVAVADALASQSGVVPGKSWRPGDGLAAFGKQSINGMRQIMLFMSFMGQALLTFVSLLPRPWRWRVTALTAQVQQAGLNAVPIVMLLNFLVGAVVAFLGATVLRSFGATIYTVDLVAYAFMREMGVLLAAILLAGRTASAFTAQIGSMKVNEEIDALQAQGLSPMELLVLPRVIALLIVLPLLTFLAIVAGMAGGAAVAILSLDISPARFMAIVQEIPLRHMLLGLSKAPVFALLIALIGCLEGFKVQGSAQSVGEHTTSAVVQSIFVVILLNAVAAMFFMEMGW
jgi:phospholipid/cholesterol/gamma-HCH transport system permease protein